MRKGETAGRLDPNYVHISKILKTKFENSSFQFVNLGKCIDYIQYGISSLANTEEKGVPIIRMNNLKGDDWDFSSLKHIELSEKDLETYRVLNGDLLFNRTNSKELVGKCGVFREVGDWVFASYLIRVRVNENILLPDFASFFLGSTTGRLQIDCLSRQIIGMTNINAEEIKLIKVPIPTIEQQTEFIKIFEAAYNAKRAKEAEAKSLLDGIDAYLLERLGIEKPAATDAKKTFFVRSSRVFGGRFDPEFIAYQAKVSSDKYSTVQLKQLLKVVPQYGANESGIERTNKSQPRYIRITDIDEFGRLDESDLGKTAAIIEERYILQNNDLLFARSGNTVGKCYLHKSDSVDYECFFAGYMIRFIVNEKQALPDYIFYWTQTKFYKDWVIAIRRAAGQPNINAQEYKSLLIPLPPLEIQEEITAHIQSIRERTKELERDAQAEVERAKQEIERMILGEVSADA